MVYSIISKNMNVYVVLEYKEWQAAKHAPYGSQLFIEPECKSEVFNWLTDQVIHRLENIVHTTVHPVSAFMRKEDALVATQCARRKKRVLCRVRVNPCDIVPYNDHDFVHVLNSFGNNLHSFLSISEAEYHTHHDASKDMCIASYERMFDLQMPRETRWTGPCKLCCFVPHLTRAMIRRAAVYRGMKRLRKKKL